MNTPAKPSTTIVNADPVVGELDLIKDALLKSEDKAELVPIEFLEFRSNKFSTILNQDSPEAYQIRERDHVIAFTEPVFVTNIFIKVESNNKSAARDLGVSFQRATDGEVIASRFLPSQTEFVYAKIQSSITSITLTPDYSFFSSKIKASKILIYGYSESGVIKLINKMDEYNKNFNEFKDKYENYAVSLKKLNDSTREEKRLLSEGVEELSNTIENLEIKKSTLTSEIEIAEGRLDETKNRTDDEEKKYSQIQQQLSDSNTALGIVNDLIEQKKFENTALNEQITKAKAQLKEIISDKNLFSDELKSYAEQGSKNARLYFWLAVAPIAIITVVTIQLFRGAISINEQVELLAKAGLSDFLLSRIPFTLVCIFSIHASYYLCKAFITRLMEIHRDRLQLSKLAIVARDVSQASVEKLDVPDEVIYEYRTKLKMDLLRAHLTKELGESYEYEPEKHLSKVLFPKLSAIFKGKGLDDEVIEKRSNPLPVSNVADVQEESKGSKTT